MINMSCELKTLREIVSDGRIETLYAAGNSGTGWNVFFRSSGKEYYLTSKRSNKPRPFKTPLPLFKLVDELKITLNVVPTDMTIANITTRIISMMIVCQILPSPANLGNIIPLASEDYTSKTNKLGIPPISDKDIINYCGDFMTDKSIYVMHLKGSIDSLKKVEKQTLGALLVDLNKMGPSMPDDERLINSVLDSLTK